MYSKPFYRPQYFEISTCLIALQNPHPLYIDQQMETQYRPVIDAYRTIGQVISNCFFLQRQPITNIVACTNKSYKIYSSDLKIQNISPVFPNPIAGVFSHSNSMYVRTGTKLLKMSYSHIVREWEIGCQVSSCNILVFGQLVLLGEKESVVIVDGQSVQVLELGFELLGVLHPLTYVNKILVYGRNKLQLWNIVNKYMVYDFSQGIDSEILAVAVSPKVDVVAVSTDRSIILLNLKSGKVLFQLVQKQPASCLCFSDSGIPMLATGDQAGNVRVWSLNTKSILGVINAHQGSVDYLEFFPGQLLLVSASKLDNSIKQWKYDDAEALQFRKLRERVGLKKNIVGITIQSNTEVVINSSDETLYMSMISDNNNYLLPLCLDSLLPTHIVAKGKKLVVYKNQTTVNNIDAGVHIELGKISQSQNYYVVSAGNKLVRVGGGDRIQWDLEGKVLDIVVAEPYHIFAIVEGGALWTLPFSGPAKSNSQGTRKRVNRPSVLESSLDKNFIAYSGSQVSEVINTKSLQVVRSFQHQNDSATCMTFSNDNRFLFASGSRSLKILDILHGNTYKQFHLNQQIVSLQMTPDGSYLLSAIAGERQISVWNNFLGVVSTSSDSEQLKFQSRIVKLPDNLRCLLTQNQTEHQYNGDVYQSLDKQLEGIPDAVDTIQLTKQPLSQWLPLVHYDQIKQRNRPVSTVQKKIQTPFFLDSESKTQFISKMDQSHKEKLTLQSRILDQKQYKLMEQNSRKIVFSSTEDQSTRQIEYTSLMETLKGLSMAELDFQLRSLVMVPQNIPRMVEFLQYMLSSKSDYDIKVVYCYRFLTLLGTSMIQNQDVALNFSWSHVSALYEYTSEVVERLTINKN